jgi:DNA-binding NarL/FixJ family response regulator
VDTTTGIEVLAGEQDSHPSKGPGITVLVADDHPVVREGMQCILERQPDVTVIGGVGTASDAISEAARLKPRIVFMDITMPGMNGIEATRLLVDQVPDTAVIILSTHSSPIIVRRAVESGARGYLSKDTNPDELVRAVRIVAAGKRYIGQGLVQTLFEVPMTSRPDLDALLTTTERNILKLVAEGSSNAQVAAMVGLSARTVETYRLRMMRKLGLDNLPSLVRYAIRHGIIPLE